MPLTDPRVSATFAALLAREREALNARFVRGGALLGRSSRAEGARVDPEVMLAFLERTAQPIVDAAPVDARRALLFELFDLVLAGVSLKLVGERDTPSAFERGLVGAWPALGAHASPTLLRALGNAFEKLTRELGEAAATRWLEELAKVAHLATERATLQEAGFLLAWRAGLARARGRVFERAPAASPALLSAIFGVEALDRDPARRFVAPSHRGPLGPLEVVARLGGFLGFGGVFRRPPRVLADGERVLATDGSASFVVHADAFGSALEPSALGDANESTASAPSELVKALPELDGASSMAEAGGLVAVALAKSHLVFVLGRRATT